jgi:hypothetical protein
LCAQEKVPKEKGTRCPRRLTPVPCVPRQAGGARNRVSQPVRDEASRRVELDLRAGGRGKSGEFGERPNRRETQGTRNLIADGVPGKSPGPPFFWVLFFGGAKKSTLPGRAKYVNKLFCLSCNVTVQL